MPFKKGQKKVGGRKLGSKNLKTAFEAVASLYYGPVTFPGGITRELNATEKVTNAVMKKALKGDLRAADMYFDRTAGKVALPIKQIGTTSGKLTVAFDRGFVDPTPQPNEEGSDGKPDGNADGNITDRQI
jgi:hypothetical protein